MALQSPFNKKVAISARKSATIGVNCISNVTFSCKPGAPTAWTMDYDPVKQMIRSESAM